MTFDDAFEKLIGHEGGYSNRNPQDDPGGETMYGITKRVARMNGYLGPMIDLPLPKAKAIAKIEYWDVVRADLLPSAVRFDVFDGAYNSGPVQSIKWLQRAVYAVDDGKFGPKTMMAVVTYSPIAIAARYNGHRLDTINDLKNWNANSRGWTQRLAKNLIDIKG